MKLSAEVGDGDGDDGNGGENHMRLGRLSARRGPGTVADFYGWQPGVWWDRDVAMEQLGTFKVGHAFRLPLNRLPKGSGCEGEVVDESRLCSGVGVV